MEQKRLARDLDQWLGRVAHPLAEPRPEAAGEDADRDHPSMTVSTVTRSRSGAFSRSTPWLDSRMKRGRRLTSS